MADNKPFKPIPELIEEIKLNTDKLESGNLSLEELYEVLNSIQQLYERAIILKYKAEEKLIKGNGEETHTSFRLKLKKDKQLSLDEVISDTVKEKLEKAQISFIDDVDDSAKIEEKTEPIEPVASASLNQKFSENKTTSLGDKLKKAPITDLTKAIGVNAKFLFMNDLFKGENEVYKEAVNRLNQFSSFDEASGYIMELKAKFAWDEENQSVERFVELVERRYL